MLLFHLLLLNNKMTTITIIILEVYHKLVMLFKHRRQANTAMPANTAVPVNTALPANTAMPMFLTSYEIVMHIWKYG